jgi:hypothetical protein
MNMITMGGTMPKQHTGDSDVLREWESDFDRLMDWAESGKKTATAIREDEACEGSDIATDRFGLPSGTMDEEAEADPQILIDRREIECGCSVEESCECDTVPKNPLR